MHDPMTWKQKLGALLLVLAIMFGIWAGFSSPESYEDAQDDPCVVAAPTAGLC